MHAIAPRTQTILSLLGTVAGSHVTSAIGCVFRRMDIAEQEIKRAMSEWPDHAPVLWRMFKAARSPIVETRMPDSLFRCHVRQFLRNIATGVDPDRPTKVEVAIMVTVGTTHVGPPPSALSRLFLGDDETVAAFGGCIEPLPSLPSEGIEYWPLLTQTCRKAYKAAGGQTRAAIVKEALQHPAPAWVYKQYTPDAAPLAAD